VELELGGRAPFARLVLEKEVDSPPGVSRARRGRAPLSLPETAVREAWFGSVGVPFCSSNLPSAAAVDRARSIARRGSSISHERGAQPVSLCRRLAPGGRLYARMFAPAYGIEEDAASGSACAAWRGA